MATTSVFSFLLILFLARDHALVTGFQPMTPVSLSSHLLANHHSEMALTMVSVPLESFGIIKSPASSHLKTPWMENAKLNYEQKTAERLSLFGKKFGRFLRSTNEHSRATVIGNPNRTFSTTANANDSQLLQCKQTLLDNISSKRIKYQIRALEAEITALGDQVRAEEVVIREMARVAKATVAPPKLQSAHTKQPKAKAKRNSLLINGIPYFARLVNSLLVNGIPYFARRIV